MTPIYLKPPPNYTDILKAFPGAKGHGVLFAYAPAIYNPSGIHIPPALIAHEQVHIARQGTDPEDWWYLYIRYPEFRYDEELLAHFAELKVIQNGGGNRHQRRAAPREIARKLSNPLYRYRVTLKQASRDLATMGTLTEEELDGNI